MSINLDATAGREVLELNIVLSDADGLRITAGPAAAETEPLPPPEAASPPPPPAATAS